MQWKKSIVPISKTKPPRMDKLGPVSLTDCFPKIVEGFVTNLVLEDMIMTKKLITNNMGISKAFLHFS